VSPATSASYAFWRHYLSWALAMKFILGPSIHFCSACELVILLLSFQISQYLRDLTLMHLPKYFWYSPDTFCAQPPQLLNLKQVLSLHLPLSFIWFSFNTSFECWPDALLA
jgi:hypothetical protein